MRLTTKNNLRESNPKGMIFFMNNKIKIGIVGYGNLGRGVESAVTRSSDMELVALLTRRDPATVKTATNIPTYGMDAAASLVGKVDVMILCGGSANDLPTQTPDMPTFLKVHASTVRPQELLKEKIPLPPTPVMLQPRTVRPLVPSARMAAWRSLPPRALFA
jgi:hypothetical protein